jgi:AcrR family transcriptional regulator
MTTNNDLSPRQRILLSAHDLFYAHGIRATGIDKIIKTAAVTKVTFYRHFPSKNDLIIEFLNYRHQNWITWFKQQLHHNGRNTSAIVPTLLAWFESDGYRGCAFINSVGELGENLQMVTVLSQQHKQDMTQAIKELLPQSDNQKDIANALTVAIDGAIIKAQIDRNPKQALAGLAYIIKSVS